MEFGGSHFEGVENVLAQSLAHIDERGARDFGEPRQRTARDTDLALICTSCATATPPRRGRPFSPGVKLLTALLNAIVLSRRVKYCRILKS